MILGFLNAYEQAPATEKLWTSLGPELSKDVVKTELIVRALYDLKSPGAAFRSDLAICMESLGNQSCSSYLLCYAGDILCIHHKADAMLERLHKSFSLKPGLVIQKFTWV